MADPCAELVARCFAARTAAHVAHLTTRSFSVHAALHVFYEEIAEKADKFAEVYMGSEGLIEKYPAITSLASSPLDLVVELQTWLRENRDECADGRTELANLIDELLSTCGQALYKIRFLK